VISLRTTVGLTSKCAAAFRASASLTRRARGIVNGDLVIMPECDDTTGGPRIPAPGLEGEAIEDRGDLTVREHVSQLSYKLDDLARGGESMLSLPLLAHRERAVLSTSPPGLRRRYAPRLHLHRRAISR
jgi:hypothetical protein